LALNAQSLGLLLELTGLVDDTNCAERIGYGVEVLGDAALQWVANALMIPGVIAEELLERADSGVGCECDGFDGFAREVGEEPLGIGAKVFETSLVGVRQRRFDDHRTSMTRPRKSNLPRKESNLA
jgi:hypothetical protein